MAARRRPSCWATGSPRRASSTGIPTPVVDAVLDAGIRAVYTPAIFDVPDAGPGSTGRPAWPAPARVVDATAGKDERLQIGFGPHAAYTVPPEGLRGDRGRGPAAATRCCRSTSPRPRPSAQVVQERYGMSAPALLAAEGVLEGRVLAAHAVWLDDADLGAAGRARRGGGALPGLQRQARARGRAAARAARARRAGRAGHRRPGLQRRPPPVGRDAPGRAPRPGHRRRPRRR